MESDERNDPTQREPDLGEAWRRAGLAFGELGTNLGDSVRTAWTASGADTPDRAGEGLRRLGDLLDRSVDTARSAAKSPESRERVNSAARRAGEHLEYAVRLSLSELGRQLERAAPRRGTGAADVSAAADSERAPRPSQAEGDRATVDEDLEDSNLV